MEQSITINPNRQTVETCLKNKSYYIDFYQREYVWSKDTVRILLNDIFYTFELSYEQYKDAELTQELLEKFNWYYLNIFITNNINGKKFIVDGQQRLSTLTLVATKLYHCTKNEYLKATLKECIFIQDKWKGNIFGLDHEKRKYIMEKILIGDDMTKPQSYKNKTEETLWERYSDISKSIDDRDMDSKKLDTFISYFLERLVLVELSISKDDTPMIFEVINDRGESLKPFEILKGKLVGALDKNDTEKYSNEWDGSIQKLSDIEDDFFSDYLKSRFIFKKNSKIETEINNSYHRYIFEKNEIGDSLAFRKTDKEQIENIKTFISKDLKYYSNLYSKIRNNDNEFLQYNNTVLSLNGQYQIILSACTIDDVEENEKINTIAKEYDRLYVLLTLNGAYNSNSFQDISYMLNEKIKNSSIIDYRTIFDDVIIQAIRENRSSQNVNSLLEYHTFLSLGYNNLEKRFLRYYLARVEKFICDGLRCNISDNIQNITTRTGEKTGYHIEHILSHNETNLAYFEDEEEFENKRNMLGGLLLLKGKDNISSGNEEYCDKLKTYSAGLVWGHTLCKDFYHTNKNLDEFNSILKEKINLEIEYIDEFDKNALEKRSKLLYQLTKLVWEI